MKKKRILYSILIGGWGGLEKYPLLVHDKLAKCGYEVFVLTTYNSELHQQCKKKGIPVFTIKQFKKLSIRIIKFMRSITIRNEIDIVHSRISREIYNWRFALWKLPEIRFILSFHIGVANKNNFFHRFFYKRVDKIIAITNQHAEKMQECLPVTSDRITRIYNGVDLEKFQQTPKTGTFRKEYGIPARNFVFTGIGNLAPAKGVEEFIRAAAILNKNYPHLTFIWTGKDTYSSAKNFRQQMRNLVRKSELNKKFIFTGYREDIPAVLHDSNVFVMAAHKEAFGNVYIEAMAAGLPVIACNTGGAQEIIKTGENGFLVDPENYQQLTNTMEKYVVNKKLVKKHGKKSLLLCRQFDLKTHIENLINIYEGH